MFSNLSVFVLLAVIFLLEFNLREEYLEYHLVGLWCAIWSLGLIYLKMMEL